MAARSRPRHQRGISATRDGGVQLERCNILDKGHHVDNGVCSESAINQLMKRTNLKRKRRTNTHTPPPTEPIPELSNEIVSDILVRLPVKSLLRCKSVCKAWRAMVTDPFFIRAHLHWSASKSEENPCLIVTPHTIGQPPVSEGSWPTTFSNHIRFYLWQQGVSMATLLHDRNFGNEFRCLRRFAQCDGLVLVPTDTKLYLFNPATRETVTLPDGRHRRGGSLRYCCLCVNLGLEPRTGKYKVVRAFYRSIDPDTNMGTDMGMEVFTISASSNDNSGRGWREIRDDLPYPAENWRTGVSINGFMFWRLPPKGHGKDQQQPPRGLLWLSLADETFGITMLPDNMDLMRPDSFTLDVLRGELCVSARISEDVVSMWMLPVQEDGGGGRTWEQRHTIYLSGMYRPLAFLPGGRMMLNSGVQICLYDIATAELTVLCKMDCIKYQGRRARTWKNLFACNVRPYTESLVRINN